MKTTLITRLHTFKNDAAAPDAPLSFKNRLLHSASDPRHRSGPQLKEDDGSLTVVFAFSKYAMIYPRPTKHLLVNLGVTPRRRSPFPQLSSENDEI